jgi:FKBP-type peptidyl-prolyl cis-trans isomerase
MTDLEKMSYALGMSVAGNITEMPVEIDIKSVIEAISDVAAGKDTKLSVEEFHANMQAFQTKLQKAAQEVAKKEVEQNKQAGAQYLFINGQKEGVKTTDTGLQYKVLVAAEGPKPSATDKVKVHYTGKLLNGTVFDSSVQRGQPISFALNQVIPGWTEGVQLMSVGSKFEFTIPSDLAYGDRGAGASIPGGSTLIFEVELLGINED